MIMDLSTIAGYLAGITYAFAGFSYVRDVAQKKVKVSIAANFIFALINASQLVALINTEIWGPVPFTVISFMIAFSICILSLRNKKIYFATLDKIGLVGALIGLVIWQLTNDPTLNIYILSIVNILVFVPVVTKTFKYPDYETIRPWRINFLATCFLLLTINSASLVVWIVPAREFIGSLFMNVALTKKRKK